MFQGRRPEVELLDQLVEITHSKPWKPFNRVSDEDALIWQGRSSDRDSLCVPVY